MSTRKRKAAFNPNALDDMDDLLPPMNLVRDAAAAGGKTVPRTGDERATPPAQGVSAGGNDGADRGSDEMTGDKTTPGTDASSERHPKPSHALTVVADHDSSVVQEPTASGTGNSAVVTQGASGVAEDVTVTEEERIDTRISPTEGDDKQSAPRRTDARRKNSRRDSPTTSVNRPAPPEVALPHEIYTALRALTLNERSADPAKARSYGQVVLDAVEEHAGELKTHWTATVSNSGTGLFKRAEAGRPTRRRHNVPQSRVPLAGVINSDAAVLDQLAIDWGAGSRSALVEQALRLYLRVE